MKKVVKEIISYVQYLVKRRKKMFPSIFIAGFQKCGTTSLYDYLVQLPSLEAGSVKEKNNLSYNILDLNDYISNFPSKKKGKKTLCGSHQLTYFPNGLARLKKIAPDSKIVLILRDPADRAYSLYQHNCRHSNDGVKSFANWVDIEMKIINSLVDIEDTNEVFEKTKWRGREPNSWDMEYKLSTGMNITRGIYYNYIKIIKDLGFDYYCLFLEELKTDFDTEMTSLLHFLNIDTKEVSFINKLPKNTGGYKDEMLSETRKILESFYEPHNEKLFNLLKRDNPWS